MLSNEERLAASDLVAILEPIKNEKNADKFEWESDLAQGISTTFTVISVFKGATVAKTLGLKISFTRASFLSMQAS